MPVLTRGYDSTDVEELMRRLRNHQARNVLQKRIQKELKPSPARFDEQIDGIGAVGEG